MAIKKGDCIKVEYEGSFQDGTIFDSTELNGGTPLKFEVGKHQLISGFENSVIGKENGDEFEIILQPSEAYGDKQEGLSQVVSKSQFPKGPTPEVGMMIMVMGPQGQAMPASITSVEGEDVTIDLNHPLAGKTLKFKIKIVETGCEPDPPHACGCGCGHDHDNGCSC